MPPGGYNQQHMPPQQQYQQPYQQQQYPQQPYPQQQPQQYQQPYQQQQQQFSGPGQQPPSHTGPGSVRLWPLPTAYAIAKGQVQGPYPLFDLPKLPMPQWQWGVNYSDELDSGRAATAAATAKLLERARVAGVLPEGQAAAQHAHGTVQPPVQQAQQQQQQQPPQQQHAHGGPAGTSGASDAQSQGTKRSYDGMVKAPTAAAVTTSAAALPSQHQQQQQQQGGDDDPAGYGRQAVSYEDMYDDDTVPAVGPQYAAR